MVILNGSFDFPGHCSDLKTGVTLSVLRLKLWGLLF